MDAHRVGRTEVRIVANIFPTRRELKGESFANADRPMRSQIFSR